MAHEDERNIAMRRNRKDYLDSLIINKYVRKNTMNKKEKYTKLAEFLLSLMTASIVSTAMSQLPTDWQLWVGLSFSLVFLILFIIVWNKAEKCN